jgi:acetyl-CoA carboxylase biotin carboxyl carrier protein
MNDELISRLIDKFSAANVAELDIEEGSLHIILRKDSAVTSRAGGAAVPLSASVPVPQAAALAATATLPTGAAAGEGAVRLGLPVASSPTADGEAITSPIVATFYASPGPDAPVFVTAGAKVKAGDTLCILEAMKMMNHLEAEFDCEILAVKAGSGDLVEYGQVLFEVKRL